MRLRAFYWLLTAVFVWVLLTRVHELERIAQILAAGQWRWLLLAVTLQVGYHLIFTALHHAAFNAVGVRTRMRDLLPLVFSALFVNVATPVGGAGGAALFVDDAARRGESPSRTAAGMLVVFAADLGAFLIILVPGLLYLFTHHDLRLYELGAAALLLALVGGLVGMLALGLWSPHLIRRVLAWLQHRSARLRIVRAPAGDEMSWADRIAADFGAAARALAERPRALTRVLATAFTAHLVDIFTLNAIILAYHASVSPGIVVAAYGVAVLFWIVAITPQGIGIVEGAMAVTLASLGIPAARAVAIALAFRGLSFWLPLAVGFILLRRLRAFAPLRRPTAEAWPVHAAALLAGAAGVIDIILALRPHVGERIGVLVQYLPFIPRHGAHLASLVAGFALLALAGNLWRRKRAAWILTLLLLTVSAVTHALRGFHGTMLAVAALAVWMATLRPHYHARSDPPSAREGLRALAGAVVGTLAYGAAGFYVLDRHFSVRFSLWDAIRQSFVMFVEFSTPELEPITGFGRYFADSIYVIAAVSLAYAAVMLTRPVLIRQLASAGERARARTVVEAFGHSSLARLTLLTDKAYFFSAGGSVVAYVAVGRSAPGLGDPIGPPGDAAAAIAEFATFCRRNDWQPAFYQTLPDHLDQYHAAGFSALHIGNEAIVDVAAFSLEGKAMKEVRGAVNRLTRLGYQAVVHQPPLSPRLLADLRAVSDEWLTIVKGTEKRFSLGWFDDDYIQSGPVMAMHDADDTVMAFANVISEYQNNECTIDLMRRRRSAEPGTMDVLFVSLFEWARTSGFATFNLGLSPLAGVGAAAGDPTVERTLHYIYDHVTQFYNFKGLYRFKQKFHPRWSPRYLIYSGLSSLPAVALAIISADAGQFSAVRYLRDVLRRPRDLRPGPAAAGGG